MFRLPLEFLFLKPNDNEISFEDFTKIIQKREVIVLYKSFLKSLKITNIHARDILAAYVVVQWPEIVLPKEHDDIDKEYFEYSKEMIFV